MKRKDRNEKGQFLKGTVPNPTGRPKKKEPWNLEEFLTDDEKRLLERYVNRAFESDIVLIDLVNRILK